jgi:hypothetical protein
MRKLALFALVATLGWSAIGCARPNEIGYTPAYTAKERANLIARNWDYEGKQSVDDIDHLLLLRPAGHLTIWNVQ